jgi:hypothetical protein
MLIPCWCVGRKRFNWTAFPDKRPFLSRWICLFPANSTASNQGLGSCLIGRVGTTFSPGSFAPDDKLPGTFLSSISSATMLIEFVPETIFTTIPLLLVMLLLN